MATLDISANELVCLNLKGYNPEKTIIGNIIHSSSYIRNLDTGIRSTVGKELPHLTKIIKDARITAYQRMMATTQNQQQCGIIRITNEIVQHPGYTEFLSSGTRINSNANLSFTVTESGQEFYALLDAGYQPISFVMGNVVYSSGFPISLFKSFDTLTQGKKQIITDIINETRYLAFERIIADAKQYNANAILNIQTVLLPIGNAREMIMTGTAVSSPHVNNETISSNLNAIELWNLAKSNYLPIKLIFHSGVYSLGIANNLASIFSSLSNKENSKVSSLIYEARIEGLTSLDKQSSDLGTEKVIGVKTYFFQLGNGLIEIFTIGTAIKKSTTAIPQTEQLPLQVITTNKNTFFNDIDVYYNVQKNTPASSLARILTILIIIIGFIYLAKIS